MKKHLTIKASVLLVVILFHSFVLVPGAHASAMQGILGRLAFRAMSPAFVAGISAGTAVVLAVGFGIGVDYIVFKSGAITALKDWWNANLGAYQWHTDGSGVDWFPGVGGHVHIYYISGSWYWAARTGSTCPGGYSAPFNAHPCSGAAINSAGPYASAAAAYTASVGGSPPSYQMNQFTDSMDYGQQLNNSQPAFPANSVYATPGAVNRITGGADVTKTATMTDADADRFIAGLGATPIDTGAGTQAGSPPTTTDNTVTAGDSAQIGLLERMANYLSNLLGIKTATEGIKTSVDNAVVGIQNQTAVLDNVGTRVNAMKGTMDNVGTLIQNQTAVLDNVGADIRHMDNTLSGINTMEGTSSTVQTRIDALKQAASTKFPFSLVASLSLGNVSGTGTYEFTSLPLTPGISVPIAPMAGPLSSLLTWFRQLLVWFFWAGTLFTMLRKVMEM